MKAVAFSRMKAVAPVESDEGTQRAQKGFPYSSVSKESACNAGDLGNVSFISGLGRSPGGGNGNPLQCSCLGNPMEKSSLAGYSPWTDRKSVV